MQLCRHPDTPSSADFEIAADVRRDGGRLVFDYEIKGVTNGLRLAAASAPLRMDGLWSTTCFEAFLRAPGAAPYVELNFAPSTRWAAYRFAAFREGMAALDMPAPRLFAARTADAFRLRATVDAAALPSGPLRLALAVVLEEQSGAKSYWALAHPPGKPDFHAASAFVFDLEATGEVS